MATIALIPARSGSKGLPNKNIMNLLGKPLFAYTIEAALQSNCFEKVFVTTDSLEYAELASAFGAEVIMRGSNESNDSATSYIVIKHALESLTSQKIDIDNFVLLQPTSPLRTSTHIKEALQMFYDSPEMDFVVSMVKSSKSSSLIQTIEDGTLKNYQNKFKEYFRQIYDEYYPNGAIFIAKVNAYLDRGDFFGPKSKAYIMDSISSIDIDTQDDFEFVINHLNNENLHNTSIHLAEERINFKKLSLKNKKADWLFFGHSVLDQYPYDKLSNKSLLNWGVSGATSKQMAKLIKTFEFNTNSSQVLIMLGINDIKQKISKGDFISNIKKIINYFKEIQPESQVIISTIMHNNGNIYHNNEIIDAWNQEIRSIAKNLNIELFDLSFYDNSYGNVKYNYSTDGVHLTTEGYELLSKKLIEEYARDGK